MSLAEVSKVGSPRSFILIMFTSHGSKMDIHRIILYVLLACLLPETTTYSSDVAPIIKDLVHALSDLSKLHTEAENVIDEFAFDKYSEKLITQTMEELDINYFDEVISDLQSRLSIPDEDKRAIMAGKYAKTNIRNSCEFVFRTAQPGRFLYGRVVTKKRKNGKEIDIAYAFHRVDFKLSKRQIEVIKRRSPFIDFLFGAHKEIKYENRGIDRETNEGMMAYFRKKCRDGLLQEYPQLKADSQNIGKVQARDEF